MDDTPDFIDHTPDSLPPDSLPMEPLPTQPLAVPPGDDLGPSGERHDFRSAPESVWAKVREDYLEGLSGPGCCRRHGVGLTALRARASKEGWRRMDQPWAQGPLTRLDPDDEGLELELKVDGDLDRVEMCELDYVAVRRMMRAVLRGDASEALRWRRVRLMLGAEMEEIERECRQHRIEVASRQAKAHDVEFRFKQKPSNDAATTYPMGDLDDPYDPDDPDGLDGVFSI